MSTAVDPELGRVASVPLVQTSALVAPVIVSPGTTATPGPVLTTLTPTFTWQSISGVTGYQINIYDNTLQKFTSYTTDASTTSYTVASGALAAGDSFVWNVRGKDANGTGPESAYLYFQTPTSSPTLTAPVSVSPGTSTSPGPVLTTLTPTLTWQPVSGATGYQINVYDNTLQKSTSYTADASATSYAIPSGALAAGDSFVWNVREQVGTTTGPPSTYLFFQTPSSGPTLTAPVIVSPGTTASPGPVLTTLTPTFSWQSVNGATGYQINIYDNTLQKLTSYTTDASTTSYTVASGVLAAGDAFVWNVRGKDANGTGPESVYLYFQTPSSSPTLTAPVSVSPGTTASPGPVLTTLTPTFSWQSVNGATGYQINIYDNTLQKSTSYTTDAMTTSYTVAAGALAAGDSFVWNVRAQAGSVTGSPSTYLYFQTPGNSIPLTAPVIVSPGTTASPGPVLTTLTPTLTWQAVSGATGYQINVFDNTLQKFTSYTVGASVTSYMVGSGVLAAGDSFVWNVRALNGSVTGPPSTYYYFQTPSSSTPLTAPVSVSPGSTASPGPVLTTLTPTLTWHSVSGATGYQINVYDVTHQKFTSYKVGASVTSYTIGSGVLAAGSSFVWNVRALRGSVTGPPSTYLYFRTPTSVLTAPVTVSPGTTASPGPVLTTLTPTFTWHSVSGATGYVINIYDMTTKKLVSHTLGASATSYKIGSGVLAAGDSFIWNLRALKGSTVGPVSVYRKFQTRKA